MNSNTAYIEESTSSNARVMLSLILVAIAGFIGAVLISKRSLDVGTDTYNYAMYFLSSRDGFVSTRFEPGFVLLTRFLSATRMSVAGYQFMLFTTLLLTIVAASKNYFDYLGRERSYLTFLVASLMFLYLSPMFVNASINAVRQGLAALLVFTALLAFQRKQWRKFFLYGLLATSFHYSSAIYLACAPTLFFSVRMLRIIAVAAFVAYCTGLTLIVVRTASPLLYNTVMDYSLSSDYRAGVRIDFAVFASFWYVLPFLMAPLVRKPISTRIKESTAVYLVMLLPFFLLGWGNFSNRYLLPAYLAASLIVAAVFCYSRLPMLRNPILLRVGLVVSCAVFSIYVIHQVIV